MENSSKHEGDAKFVSVEVGKFFEFLNFIYSNSLSGQAHDYLKSKIGIQLR